jgi:hypothetical protein
MATSRRTIVTSILLAGCGAASPAPVPIPEPVPAVHCPPPPESSRDALSEPSPPKTKVLATVENARVLPVDLPEPSSAQMKATVDALRDGCGCPKTARKLCACSQKFDDHFSNFDGIFRTEKGQYWVYHLDERQCWLARERSGKTEIYALDVKCPASIGAVWSADGDDFVALIQAQPGERTEETSDFVIYRDTTAPCPVVSVPRVVYDASNLGFMSSKIVIKLAENSLLVEVDRLRTKGRGKWDWIGAERTSTYPLSPNTSSAIRGESGCLRPWPFTAKEARDYMEQYSPL